MMSGAVARLRVLLARLGPRTGRQLSVHLTLANAGATTDSVIAAASDLLKRAIIRELEPVRGLVPACALRGSALRLGSRQSFRPGRAQITFTRLRKPSVPVDLIRSALSFERAGLVQVRIVVESLGQPDHAPIADRIDERTGLRR